MSLSRHQAIFGIHSIAAYNPDTFEPYGIAKVVGAFSFNQAGESIPLNGGASLNPWEVENGVIESTGSLTLREFPDWLFQSFMGNAATTGAAEAGGGATSITNLGGSSVVAATGIASVGVKSGSEADVKTGIYMVKAVSATTVDVYALTDVDFARGTDLTFQNDSLKITASALTIATGTAVTIPNTGLELTGGVGTIGMTEGDTAWFDSRSINSGYTTATIGGSNSTYVDVGLVCAAQKKGNGEVFLIDICRAKVNGVPFPFSEKAWMESEVNFSAFYDSTRDAVFRYMRVNG